MPQHSSLQEHAKVLLSNTVFDKEIMQEFMTIAQRDELKKLRLEILRSLRLPNGFGVLAPYTPSREVNIFHLYLLEKLKEIIKSGIPVTIFLRDQALDLEPQKLREQIIEKHLSIFEYTRKNIKRRNLLEVIRESTTVFDLEGKAEETYKALKMAYGIFPPDTRTYLESVALACFAAMLKSAKVICVGEIERTGFDFVIKAIIKAMEFELHCLYLPSLPLRNLDNLIYLEDSREVIEKKVRNEFLRSNQAGRFALMLYRFLIYRDEPKQYQAKKRWFNHQESIDAVVADFTEQFWSYRQSILANVHI